MYLLYRGYLSASVNHFQVTEIFDFNSVESSTGSTSISGSKTDLRLNPVSKNNVADTL